MGHTQEAEDAILCIGCETREEGTYEILDSHSFDEVCELDEMERAIHAWIYVHETEGCAGSFCPTCAAACPFCYADHVPTHHLMDALIA